MLYPCLGTSMPAVVAPYSLSGHLLSESQGQKDVHAHVLFVMVAVASLLSSEPIQGRLLLIVNCCVVGQTHFVTSPSKQYRRCKMSEGANRLPRLLLC